MSSLPSQVSSTLHVYVAFDWGDEIDLATVARLVPSTSQKLARRSRTPASVDYRTMPLRLPVGEVNLAIGSATVAAPAELTLFDFGAVSLSMHAPLERSPDEWQQLAGCLSDTEPIVQAARSALQPVYDRLLPAIKDAAWSPLSEEFFVFHFAPGALPEPQPLLTQHASWLAALSRLEDEQLSNDEVAESLRQRISYTPSDLFICEWSAAVLVDQACDETLQTIEFANLQLLEFRHIDERLDQRLSLAARMVHPSQRRWFPFFTSVRRRLRDLGELRIETHDLYERAGNALKLLGDQYVARVYQMLASRFHLSEWQRSIEQSLSVIEDAYQVLSDESDTNRGEILEWIVILLIAFEVAMALLRH